MRVSAENWGSGAHWNPLAEGTALGHRSFSAVETDSLGSIAHISSCGCAGCLSKIQIDDNASTSGGETARAGASGFEHSENAGPSETNGLVLSAAGGDDGPLAAGDDIADDITTTTSITVGGTLNSSIQHSGDLDYISISLVAGQTYTFSLDGGTLFDSYVELRDSSGALIASNDDGGVFLDSFLMFTATQTGTHYIVTRGFDGGSTGTYSLTVDDIATGSTSPTTFVGNSLPYYSWEEAAIQISRSGAGWMTSFGASTVVTYAFRTSAPAAMPSDTAGFSVFSAAQITAAEAALAAWAAVANITFVRVDDGGGYSNNATILFGNYSTGEADAAAFAYLPSSGNTSAASVEGDVWINSSIGDNANPVVGGYGPQVLLHEIGHALGLSHPGDYNAGEGSPTYPGSAVFYGDTRMFTIMSYFASVNTGGNYNNYASLPQVFDISAMQRLYGANLASRAGDTIYGFNSNTGLPEYALAFASQQAVFCVWDGGGNDTLDFSGYTTSNTIDLRAESFSSVGPRTGGTGLAHFNVSIAHGVIVENAIGGSGDDTIIGNDANNVIDGRGGFDNMSGGLGDDTYYVNHFADVVNEALSAGNDTVNSSITFTLGANVENLTLTGASTINGTGNASNNIITGNDQNNTLTGLDGDDTLLGGIGVDALLGGNNNDTLNGGAGADNMSGGDGNDSYVVDDAGDAVTESAGQGTDSVQSSVTFTLGVNVENLTLTGAANIDGTGNGDANVLIGNSGANVLTGAAGADSINGGDGNDTANYAGSDAGVTVSLFAGTASGGQAQGDTLSNIENLTGSAFNDTLTGDGNANTITGGGGSDTIRGGAGIDTLSGGEGDDGFIYAIGDGADAIDGGNGTDALTISSGSGAQTLDVAFNGSVLTNLNGGALANLELISADLGAGVDVLRYIGSSGGVTINIATSSASGFTQIVGIDDVVGSSFDDLLAGASGVNNLSGGEGDDQIYGFGGNDTLLGGGGADLIVGEGGDDIINGGDSNDTIRYTLGHGLDTVDGGDGIDTLVIIGRPMDEILGMVWNGTNFTSYKGGTLTSIELASVDMGNGNDTLRYTGSSAAVVVNIAAGTATGFVSVVGVENVNGTSLNDSITGNSDANLLTGEDGNDTLVGLGGNDTLQGGGGIDSIRGGGGDDIIDGGTGNDTIHYTLGDGTDATDGGGGVDTLAIAGTSGDEVLGMIWNGSFFTSFKGGSLINIEQATVDMGGGVDTLRYAGSSGNITVNLAAGTATGFTSVTGVENVVGATVRDFLTGDANANSIDGQGGNDVITGAGGADTLTGGSGLDSFVFATGSGTDTITDFDADAAGGGQDLIDITGYGITGADFATRVTVTDMGSDTLITIDGVNTILLSGVTGDGANVITQSDFIFGP